MCELFGLSSNKAVNISLSFTTVSHKNPLHNSGWGIGFYRSGGEQAPPYATIIKEPISVRDSVFNYFLKYGYIRTNMFISHFRLATVGVQAPLNTHPFQLMIDPRSDTYLEKSWLFAHSGTLQGIQSDARFQSILKPHGNTDSEHIFCYLTDQLRQAYYKNGYSLPLEERTRIIKETAHTISQAYPESFNFIISDGFRLYAYYGGYTDEDGSGMWYLTRRPPHPKLAMIDRVDGMTVQVCDKTSDQTLSVIATNRLTPTRDGEWQAFDMNELKIFENGVLVG